MPKDYPRSERLASQIQRELARLIQNSVKDPRMAAASILEVIVTKDLSQAKVYFSVLNPEDSVETQQYRLPTRGDRLMRYSPALDSHRVFPIPALPVLLIAPVYSSLAA